MKCKDFEEQIYLYGEFTEIEKIHVDAHISTCTACKELFQLVSSAQKLIASASETRPEIANHSRLTGTIIQAISGQQKLSVSWMNSLFIKCAMVAASLALIIAFGVEQVSSVENFSKTMPGTKTVTLNSAAFMKAAMEKKQKPAPKSSLYACAKSGDCNSTLIETFQKKTL